MPSEEELKEKLSPMQYEVTQNCGTEPAFHNEYWNNHQPGLYVDIISGKPLFLSSDKFDSGTGWPSFTRAISPDVVIKHLDTSHNMTRTEVKAVDSGAHLGHLFPDGPLPHGSRFCINSAALKFIPKADLEKEGYGEFVSRV